MDVSILIPCYNAERWIGQCIESALLQTWPEKEVIVVDDGSTDGSLEIVQSFGARIRWETGPNQGGNVARNRLLELSKGEWLQYLDADDYLLPEKIADHMKIVVNNPGVDVVFSRYIQETHSGGEIRQGLGTMPEPRNDPWSLLVRWDLPQTGALLWRKKAMVDSGGWKPDQPCCQEHELYLRSLKTNHRFIYSDDVGAVYRQWENGSVCTKNPREVHQRRLEIINAAADYLRESGGLTPPRLWAINHSRLEVARQIWLYDPDSATHIAAEIHSSQPSFHPNGPFSRIRHSFAYGLGYRLLGFRGAERLSQHLRLSVQR